MKKIYTLLAAVILTANVWSQAPEKMSYQAVVRNSTNNLIPNQGVGMQISILQGSVTGSVVYIETQTPTTNANGLVSIDIGTGIVVSGDFTTIDWGSSIYFIKTETDLTGGTTYTITGTSQLMSVPYALYAKTSGSSTPGPQGAQGTAGTNGIDGATGLTGTQGLTGVQGIPGANGTNGINGATGLTGAQGLQGIAGDDGTDGSTGLTGPQGLTGVQGIPGANGTNGINGATGLIGTQGLQGVAGDDGADGLDGTTGLTGAQGLIGSNGLDGATGLQGIPGTNGTNGINGATGLTGAQGLQGVAGDDGTDGVTGLQGIPGTNGTNGINGTTGLTGTQGLPGVAGNDGTDGTNGTNGINGATGLTGAQGLQGVAGDDGAIGTNGTNGINGTTGLTGAQGLQGVTGDDGADGTNGLDGTTGLQGIAGDDGTDGATGLQGIQGTNGTNGLDGTNTAQNLTLNGDTLFISDGNYVLLSSISNVTSTSTDFTINLSMDSIEYDNFGNVLFSGEVLPSGGSSITDKGFCWSTTNSNPTAYDNYTSVSTETNYYSFSFHPDLDSTTYYVRMYATNAEGISYSEVLTFNTTTITPLTLNIGDYYQGGVVYWIDPTDSTHGLICDITDLEKSFWGCYGTLINDTQHDIGTGFINTMNILNNCNSLGTAAYTCNNSTAQGYMDWFLPSRNEIEQMYYKKDIINATAVLNGGSNFISGKYSTSTEGGNNGSTTSSYAANINSTTYDIGPNIKNTLINVRAVRAF